MMLYAPIYQLPVIPQKQQSAANRAVSGKFFLPQHIHKMKQSMRLKTSRICRILLYSSLLISALGGCVIKDIGTTVKQTIKGDYYLRAEKFEKGRQDFKHEVAEDPNNPLAHYYYGRFLLQDAENKKGLVQLSKASDLEPDNPDYHFWTGIAYGEIGDKKNEAISYRAALKLNKKHLQALIYLGHNQLEKKKYKEAFNLYSRALKIWPGSPSALYNRALILKKLRRTPEELQGWHAYLSLYPSGAMARRATRHLNNLKDFSYRNHHLGPRTITIEKIWFEPFSSKLDDSSTESLKMVGAIVNNSRKGNLQIITFQKNNKRLARNKAVSIKNFLLEEFPAIRPDRIGISWFAEPQVLPAGNNKLKIDESVSFFITRK